MIHVTKASGERVPFEVDKLEDSLKRAGANEDIINHITFTIKDMMYDGISTQLVYETAFQILKRSSKLSAARYSIKKAILNMGPSGYPFEKFIGRILHFHGFKTEVGVRLEGKCVTHEIDVIAEKDDAFYLVECKFHNQMGKKSDVKTPLYIQSRYLDVVEHWSKLPGHENKKHQGWIVTNTRFTDDAQKYGTCIGLRMLSWDYPRKNNLRHFIDRAALHPITCLTNLKQAEVSRIMDEDILLCRELIQYPDILQKVGVPKRRIKDIISEAEIISHTPRFLNGDPEENQSN